MVKPLQACEPVTQPPGCRYQRKLPALRTVGVGRSLIIDRCKHTRSPDNKDWRRIKANGVKMKRKVLTSLPGEVGPRGLISVGATEGRPLKPQPCRYGNNQFKRARSNQPEVESYLPGVSARVWARARATPSAGPACCVSWCPGTWR